MSNNILIPVSVYSPIFKFIWRAVYARPRFGHGRDNIILLVARWLDGVVLLVSLAVLVLKFHFSVSHGKHLIIVVVIVRITGVLNNTNWCIRILSCFSRVIFFSHVWAIWMILSFLSRAISPTWLFHGAQVRLKATTQFLCIINLTILFPKYLEWSLSQVLLVLLRIVHLSACFYHDWRLHVFEAYDIILVIMHALRLLSARVRERISLDAHEWLVLWRGNSHLSD